MSVDLMWRHMDVIGTRLFNKHLVSSRKMSLDNKILRTPYVRVTRAIHKTEPSSDLVPSMITNWRSQREMDKSISESIEDKWTIRWELLTLMDQLTFFPSGTRGGIVCNSCLLPSQSFQTISKYLCLNLYTAIKKHSVLFVKHIIIVIGKVTLNLIHSVSIILFHVRLDFALQMHRAGPT